MCRRLWVFVLAAAGGASATPVPAVTWADWVGDWDGKLAWTSCAVDGPTVATFAVDATDGGMAIDLAGAGAAFGRVTLIEDQAGWLGQHGDVTVHVSRGKAGIDIAVALDSGCALHSSAHRATTAIAACDRLDAWARIEARCSRLGRPPLENPARLARQRESWSAARGDARTKLGAQCDARAAKVEAELVNVGCAPDPDPAIGHRGPMCQALRQSAAKLRRCGNLPSQISAALEGNANQLAAAAQTADDAALPIVEMRCEQLREDIASVAQKYACPP